jgi:hypothetical protein
VPFVQVLRKGDCRQLASRVWSVLAAAEARVVLVRARRGLSPRANYLKYPRG